MGGWTQHSVATTVRLYKIYGYYKATILELGCTPLRPRLSEPLTYAPAGRVRANPEHDKGRSPKTPARLVA